MGVIVGIVACVDVIGREAFFVGEFGVDHFGGVFTFPAVGVGGVMWCGFMFIEGNRLAVTTIRVGVT